MPTTLPLFLLGAVHEWDVWLTIGLFVLGGSMSLTGWLFKKRLEVYDRHVETCQQRMIETARMDERLSNVEHQLHGICTSVRWVGDCLLTLGARLNIELPDRPQ